MSDSTLKLFVIILLAFLNFDRIYSITTLGYLDSVNETVQKEVDDSENTFKGNKVVYLGKNIINNKNILTQNMFSKDNTCYIIQYDYDLDGKEIAIPKGCVLDFQGGSLNNGIIEGSNTTIHAGLVRIFGLNLEIYGTYSLTALCPEWFGAFGDGIENDTPFFQKAINIANQLKKDVYLSNSYYIENSLFIDREGGYRTDNSTLFNIVGTGSAKIIVNSDITIFDTKYDFSHFICFKNIKFISIDASHNAYVFNRKFVRLSFINCDFYKIKCVCAEDYLQTIYFTNCNIRKWDDIWFEAKKGLYDVRFNQCIFENDGYGTAFKAYGKIGAHMVNQLVVNSCLLEGLKYGIIYANSMNISITNNYFEGNSHGDIVSFNEDVDEFNYGINIQNNIFYSGNIKVDNTNGNGIWAIIWAKTVNGVSFGNTIGNDFKLHYINSGGYQSNINIFGERGGNTNLCNISRKLRHTYNGDSPTDIQYANNQGRNYGDIVINTNQLSDNGKVDKKSSIGWICVDFANKVYREIGLNNKLTKYTNVYGSGIVGAKIESGYSGFIAVGCGDGLSSYNLYFIDSFKVMEVTTSKKVKDVKFYRKDGELIVESPNGSLNLLIPNYVEVTSLTSEELNVCKDSAISITAIKEKSSAGSTPYRPSNLTLEDKGVQYFDTTINKPIWWTGEKWVDAMGTDV